MFIGTETGILRRITIVADEAIEKLLVEQVLNLGAESYICSYCSGKPMFNAVERSPGESSLVRIEVLVQPEQAEAIMSYLVTLQSRHYPLTPAMDSVRVLY